MFTKIIRFISSNIINYLKNTKRLKFSRNKIEVDEAIKIFEIYIENISKK